MSLPPSTTIATITASNNAVQGDPNSWILDIIALIIIILIIYFLIKRR